ncbi:helix-turn-helix domain-containing protein [Spongiactinospora sp. TRM90649]|uniref:ArsR/SmtB family transcription factor n=1 Tax=Spongiactinospora sp. TRM90649 TaxID=3031114 RepID=UPI0023F97057|nr:helix-turn-helix domain-containing protein [Spongiactinospora sp. TRM90649]MDF5752722.1 helix-turn-helix domain-containing protein [Spongiactinospora sp. TRM90649]
MNRDRPTPLSDPKAMRALAHPARLAILTRLQIEGSATATEVAEVVGVTPSAASYHLRMLAKYGFVEDAPPRGDGRERLWQARDRGMAVNPEPGDEPEVRAAKDLLIRTIRADADGEATRALSQRDREAVEWREAAVWSRSILLLDAEELRTLGRRIEELIAPYRIVERGREGVSTGARVAEAQINLFPRADRPAHGLPTEDHESSRGQAREHGG